MCVLKCLWSASCPVRKPFFSKMCEVFVSRPAIGCNICVLSHTWRLLPYNGHGNHCSNFASKNLDGQYAYFLVFAFYKWLIACVPIWGLTCKLLCQVNIDQSIQTLERPQVTCCKQWVGVRNGNVGLNFISIPCLMFQLNTIYIEEVGLNHLYLLVTNIHYRA